jgi:hypothetical protein
METAGCVRLQLGQFARGEGTTLQEAADDLIHRLLVLVMAVRSSGFSASCEVRPDLETMDFLYELGDFAAAGGDIRDRVFG